MPFKNYFLIILILPEHSDLISKCEAICFILFAIALFVGVKLGGPCSKQSLDGLHFLDLLARESSLVTF